MTVHNQTVFRHTLVHQKLRIETIVELYNVVKQQIRVGIHGQEVIDYNCKLLSQPRAKRM